MMNFYVNSGSINKVHSKVSVLFLFCQKVADENGFYMRKWHWKEEKCYEDYWY